MKKKCRILVLGSNGQIGRTFKFFIKSEKKISFYFLNQNKFNYLDSSKLKNFLKINSFNYVINCCAYTDVEKAENDKSRTKKINFIFVKELIKFLKKSNTFFIHFSTDYVYDGKKIGVYFENDKTNPLNYYGKTKVMADNLIMNSEIPAVIFRVSWLFSKWNNNFIRKILKKSKIEKKLLVINDQLGSPTYSYDLVNCIIKIIKKNYFNNIKTPTIFNFRNKGITNWYIFARNILKINKNIKCVIKPVSYKNFKTVATRPINSSLSISKFEKYFKISIPHWKNSLKHYFK
jgi:dTDP-4-dehydrorhamnose reductase